MFGTSDLHVGFRDNRRLVDDLLAHDDGDHADDWLLVVGDVGERFVDIADVLGRLRARFGTVLWVPGNHDLWSHPSDPVDLRGEERYQALVEVCRRIGVGTPEDPYPVWTGPGGPLTVAPLFLLYDYTFRPAGTTKKDALAAAYAAGVVCTDEQFLHPDPYPSADDWCAARVAATLPRLAAIPTDQRTVLVSHFPLHEAPTAVMRYPEFTIWCGTRATADWHTRFRAAVAVHGHLHIPRTVHVDGVPFQEVSLGYPREWRGRPDPPPVLREIALPPAPGRAGSDRPAV